MQYLQELVKTVQHNCAISDAQYAGNYSMCTFLLKMREYYRWEQKIPLSGKIPRDDVGSWMVHREQSWEPLENEAYSQLVIDNESFDPFDTQGINEKLLPHGYIYNSGRGIFSKPHFSLGKLLKHEVRENISILISQFEYARDLVAPPATFLNQTIFISRESLKRFLWEKIEEWKWNKRTDVPMAQVIECYPHHGDMEALLNAFVDNETENTILHEIGEARAGKLLGDEWEQMLATLSCTKAEFKARAVRDHLADCISTLPELIETQNQASLHFYFSNMTGLRKLLFPQLIKGYQEWLSSGKLATLETVCKTGEEHWYQVANNMLALFKQHNTNAVEPIEEYIAKIYL
ncbi:MAG: hypothetical protein OEW89_00285 [Gammaproteobacteria bacterium]|nr:hypothetical protein [Gammaproteobacteria bacterium]MDH5593392.1 hypothetical protein [Gammaproteobacteria bacterium]